MRQPNAGGGRGQIGRRPGPPRRRQPISPRSPLEGRQLWRIGDWGGASEQIGRRWEAVGTLSLRALLGQPRPGPNGAAYLPSRALVLAEEPELAAAVHAGGKPHADAVLLGELDGKTVLEPVDFKWTLETANPRQVGADVLAALLEEPPPLLAARLAEVRAGLPLDGDPSLLDGFFLAPDHADNRAHLAPRGPLDATWAVLRPVDGGEFFTTLPGWDVSLALAALDRARLDSLERQDRYYRLGAGVAGGLGKLAVGTFGEGSAELAGPSELDRLRSERRLTSTGEVVAYLDRALIARGELLERLRTVERSAYPIPLFRRDLAVRGAAVDSAGGERRWRALYGSVMKELGRQLRAEGRRLLSGGQSEVEALAALDAERARWTETARRVLAAHLDSAGPLEDRAVVVPDSRQ